MNDINKVIKKLLKEKSCWCNKEIFDKVKEILTKKMMLGDKKVRHFGWKKEGNIVLIVLTQYYFENNTLLLAC